MKAIKRKLAEQKLKKEFSLLKRNVQVFSLATAKTAGIIYEASNVEDYELIKKYVAYLKDYGIKTKVIGFFSKKESPAFTYPKLDYSFFSIKEITWNYLPPKSNTFIYSFIEEDLDILIDLNIQNHFPLKYISNLCKAKFKIGAFSEKNEAYYDLMFEIEKDKSLKYFLRQVDTYLQMLEKKKN